ncbi:unnamed protein product [Cylindrotheca closterium]|uniref:Uncharacterized protein n=1 Tax=Cylindrotheca closterium TaxID=2856 RepID=A0AAD2D126_9STRA|nr:unnamed protein product [Cylindrotheca closterium]
MFNPTLIVQRAEPLTWMWLAASEFFAHPWTGPAIIPPIVEEFERLEQESIIAKAQSKSKKRPASTPENPKGAKAHDSRPSPSAPMQTELTPPKGPSKPYQRTPPSDATPPRQQVVMSDAVHVIAGTPTGTQEASVPADDVVVANTHRGRTSAENGAEDHNSAPTYRDTDAALPAPTVPLTTDERLMRLLAVHWNASPFRHITIFNVSIVFDWQGVGSSEFNQVQTAYTAFHQFASGIWGKTTSKVVLLPFADGRFTRQQLWIRNLKEFDEKAKDWAHLKIYLDPNFGNPYILNKPGKTGSKTYKTRMRFGMDTAPPILMQELRVLSSEPRAGVFPTPIQVSHMVRLGFLPLLPQELAIAFAREADLILAANLDLRKPSCAVFQAPTHYTRDWQAAKDELVLGKQCPQLQSLIEAMRERTRATRAHPPAIPSWGWAPEYIYIEGDEQVLLEALKKGKLRVISDGSFKQQVGTAAVQLRTRRGGHVIWIKCRTPGKREDQSAYRSELIGLLAGILVTSWLRLRLQSLAKPRVRVACDGIAALCQAFSTWPLSPTAPHFDLLSSIREALRVSNISWAEQHVDGHADRTKTWRQTSWWERRNSEVDDIAQGYADEVISTENMIATNPKFFSEPCAIYIDNEKVSCLALESVDEAVALPELMEYWAAKGRLAPEHFRLVDWPIVHRAMKSLKPAEQRFITKHTVGMCGVSKFRKRWGLDSENRCPLCGLEEDHLHVPRCPSVRAKTQWQLLLQELQEWFQSTTTATSPNSSGPFFAPSAPLTTSLKQRLRGTASTACLLPPSPKSVRLNSALAPNVSSKAFSSTAGPTSSNNSTALAVVTNPRATALDRRIHEEFDMGLRDLPRNLRPAIRRSRLVEVLQLLLADKEEWVLVISEARRKIRRSLAGRRRLMWELTHPTPRPAAP